MCDLSRALLAQPERYDVIAYRVEQGTTHEKLQCIYRCKPMTQVFYANPSDGARGHDQTLTCLRRVWAASGPCARSIGGYVGTPMR
jgi:hypothetical protein